MEPQEIERARRETPGCENAIHFNNAGASLMAAPVLDAVKSHLDLEAAMGGYEAAWQKRVEIRHLYAAVAQLIGANAKEIAFVESATRAWDMAFYSIPFKPGDRILTAKAEYASNYLALIQVARRTGAVIEVIPNDESGQLSLAELEKMLDERVRLIAITHVPTNGGLINPAAAVGKIARKAKILYLLDACQSVGQMPIDVKEIGCDMLSATGRKYLRAPRGTGFLYVRKELIKELEPPLIDVHAATWTERDQYELRPDARRFEAWEQNICGKLGMAAAVGYALGWGLPTIWKRVRQLAEELRSRLAAIPGVAVHDLGREKCGIVTFTAGARSPHEMMLALAERAIHVTESGIGWTRLDMEDRQLESLVRASVHYYNTDDEIERFCQAVAQIAS